MNGRYFSFITCSGNRNLHRETWVLTCNRDLWQIHNGDDKIFDICEDQQVYGTYSSTNRTLSRNLNTTGNLGGLVYFCPSSSNLTLETCKSCHIVIHPPFQCPTRQRSESSQRTRGRSCKRSVPVSANTSGRRWATLHARCLGRRRAPGVCISSARFCTNFRSNFLRQFQPIVVNGCCNWATCRSLKCF